MATFLWTLLGALLSIIFYPVIIPFIEAPIHFLLTKSFGRSISITTKKKIKLSGDWTQQWTVYLSSNFPMENESTVTMSQIGKQIYGEARHNKSVFIIKGTVDKDMYFTGIWEDINDGNTYKGAFQLYIHKYATHMTGKWVGFSETNTIKSGDWFWKRADETSYKK